MLVATGGLCFARHRGRKVGFMLARLTNAFALLLCAGVAWAWIVPAHFTWFLPYISPGLGLIMLGMGLTLRFEDFAEALQTPASVAIGVLAQFVIMPLAGWSIAHLLHLPTPLAVGLILVSCCPGGTASNVITHLARANLPLSVLMTACSTLAAVLLTPWLTELLAGAYIPVPTAAMLRDMLTVVVLPVIAGLLLNRMAPRLTATLAPITPLLSVIFIILIVGAIIAAKKDLIAQAATSLIFSVFLLHAFGFALGWVVARWLRRDRLSTRTISIEVGMQNSGLGAKLATTHFATEPLAAVPSAISAVMHSLIGSALAAWWRRSSPP